MSERFVVDLLRAVRAVLDGRLSSHELAEILRRWASTGAALDSLLPDGVDDGPGIAAPSHAPEAVAAEPEFLTNPAPLGASAPVLPFGERYQFLEAIGEGGVSVVGLFQDRVLSRLVAVKELRPALADHPAMRARFAREIRLSARLEHPGIPPVHDCGQHPDGRPWFSRRFVVGETLGAAALRCHRTGGDPKRLIDAVRRACLVADYAHRRGVLHRDLKPGNILLDAEGGVHLIDWGLAKERGSPALPASLLEVPQEEQTGAGAPIGTRGFASPEQWSGEGADAASDVFTLGATLYYVLTGRVPVEPLQFGPSVPAALQAACLKALASDPGMRHPSAAALAADLGDKTP